MLEYPAHVIHSAVMAEQQNRTARSRVPVNVGYSFRLHFEDGGNDARPEGRDGVLQQPENVLPSVVVSHGAVGFVTRGTASCFLRPRFAYEAATEFSRFLTRVPLDQDETLIISTSSSVGGERAAIGNVVLSSEESESGNLERLPESGIVTNAGGAHWSSGGHDQLASFRLAVDALGRSCGLREDATLRNTAVREYALMEGAIPCCLSKTAELVRGVLMEFCGRRMNGKRLRTITRIRDACYRANGKAMFEFPLFDYEFNLFGRWCDVKFDANFQKGHFKRTIAFISLLSLMDAVQLPKSFRWVCW